MTGDGRPRIGVAFTGDPTDVAQWSGTPAGLFNGLRAAGADVSPIDVELSPAARKALGAALGAARLHRAPSGRSRAGVREAYSAGLISPAANRLRDVTAGRRLRGHHLDGIVQIGTSFRVRSDAPVATFEDMTVPQALEYAYSHWASLTEREVERRAAVQRDVYSRATAICMTNSWAAGSAIADCGAPEQKVRVVGVGSNEQLRPPRAAPSVPRFLFVGLDWERKNGPAVLRCFDRLQQERPDAVLDVVGGHPALPETPGVTTHGFLSRKVPEEAARLEELFAAATVFIMPSRFEPSAVVFTEALASSIPCIGGSVGGSADLIGDGGIVVDPTSEGQILDAMRTLADPGTVAQYSERAFARAPLFTWQAVGERVLAGLGIAPPPQRPWAEALPLRGLSAA